MSYFAYAGPITIDYTTRDEAAGIIGSLPSKPEPLATADDRASIMEKAYAHIGRSASGLVYIADSDGRLYEIVFNEVYCKEREVSEKWHCIAWALFVLCIITFVATVALGLGYTGLLVFAGIAALYLLIVRVRMENELEGAVICVMILVLSFMLTAALKVVRTKSPKGESTTSEKIEASYGLPKP